MKSAECRPAVEHAVLVNNPVRGEEPIRSWCTLSIGNKIIERTVLRTFSLGKSRLSPHVKIFSSVLKCQKNRFFALKEPFFYLRKTVFSYLPLRGKFLPHRSFYFPMRFLQAYRPHVQVRKRRNRGEVCRFDNEKGFCPELSARQLRFHCMNSGESKETNTPHYFQSVFAKWPYTFASVAR